MELTSTCSVIGDDIQFVMIIMKITEIKSFSVADADNRSYFIVKVETDEGVHGLGEVGIRWWGQLSRRP